MSAQRKLKTCAHDECTTQFTQYSSFDKHCSSACKRADESSNVVVSMNARVKPKRQRIALKAKSRRPLTQYEKDVHAALREMGCAVSKFFFGHDETPPDIHHITDCGRRKGELFVIPLKPECHRQGVDGFPSIHSVNGKHGGKKEFARVYGFDEYELLALCEKSLGFEYSKGAAR